MARAFTHYWNRKSWEASRRSGSDLDWLASSEWQKAGVQPGDILFPVTIREGVMYIGGQMTVSIIVPRAEAIRLLETDDIWEAPFIAIAGRGGASKMDYNRSVPLEIAHQLRFDTTGEPRALVVAGDGLYRQTLRRVRRLTPESADLLTSLVTPS